MTKKNRNLLWLGLAVAVALGLLWQFYPLPDAQDRVRAFPVSGLTFNGQELTYPEYMRGLFGKATVTKRGYEVGGQRVIVWIVDGTRNRHAVHDPLYCLRGDGWQVVSKNSFPVDGGEAQLIRAQKNGREAESLLWYSDGQVRHASAARYWWQATLRRLTLGRAGHEPVLITVQAVGNAPINWRQLADQFRPLFEL
ncbi:MAG: exosortase-associated EpsI family protein [Pedosphaera sp.]|nr:exosortase-associated EpsI family protein [Pedosphaera sp.]